MAFPIAAGKTRGFTLIELLVVLAIVATLLTLAAPQYFSSVDRAKDTVLKENIATLRDAIDKFYGDTGKYPETLDALVQKRYLKSLPLDPVTDKRDSWVTIQASGQGQSGIADVQSGAAGKDADGVPYKDY